MKSILLNTNEVQAILSGHKTQTRRVIKPQPKCKNVKYEYGHLTEYSMRGSCWNEIATHKPKYQVGDTLWVRETFCKLWEIDKNEQAIEETGKYYYAADGYNPTPFNYFPDDDGFSHGRDCPRWNPSVHMPKEAARLFLTVTAVRTERLQDISADDCIREGIKPETPIHMIGFYGTAAISRVMQENVYYEFSEIWNSIKAKRDGGAYAWDKNPWVWVYDFDVREIKR